MRRVEPTSNGWLVARVDPQKNGTTFVCIEPFGEDGWEVESGRLCWSSSYPWPLDHVLVEEFHVEPAEASALAERILGEHAGHVAELEGLSRPVPLGCLSVLGLALVAWLVLVVGGFWVGGVAGNTAALFGLAVPLWAWLLSRLYRWRAGRGARVLE